VGDCGRYFAVANGWQIAEQNAGEFAPNGGESVAVEKEKWRAAMERLQQV
jgi:hypothetical protein